MNKVDVVSGRRDRIEYTGKLHDFQQLGTAFKGKRYSDFEKDPFNSYQNFLYKRALFGLKVYEDQEIAVMHEEKKKRIIKVYTRAQRILNTYKQELVNHKTNMMLSILFPNSPIIKELIEEHTYTDVKFINKISFKDLGVDKVNLVERLITDNILPKNFYTLTLADEPK
jgi:hypothetical protein